MVPGKAPFLLPMLSILLIVLSVFCARGDCAEVRHAVYNVTGAGEKDTPAATRVDLFVAVSKPGDEASSDGASQPGDGVWWEMTVTLRDGRTLAVRANSDHAPMTDPDGPGRFRHYAFRPPEGPALEYVDDRTGDALLPRYDFVNQFLPAPSWGAVSIDGFADAGRFLGHQATLKSVTSEEAPPPWDDVKVLRLRPDLLIGSSYSRRDDGTGPDESGEYRYRELAEEDYDELIAAGFNFFGVSTEQLPFVRDRAVFYLHAPVFPDDFYRSNYVGIQMCADEPMIRLGYQGLLTNDLIHPHQVVSLLMTRVAAEYGPGGFPWSVEQAVKRSGVDLGTLRLKQEGIPVWEGIYEAAFYELAAGAPAIVHEGRYGSPDGHGWHPTQCLGTGLELTPEETLRCHYAFLRGAARAWGGDWGMSIYGHSQPDIRREAVTLAYDMGARYIWFWTGGAGYHIPYGEQLDLARAVMGRARTTPRGDIHRMRDAPRTAIAYPMGYTISWGRMWWGMEPFDNERRTRKGAFYREVAATGLFQGILCAKRGIDLDFTTDFEGLDGLGYDRIIRVREDASVDVWPSDEEANPPRLAVTGRWGDPRDVTVPRDATRTVHAACLYGRSPVIDGRLSDWPDEVALHLGPEGDGARNWDGPADLSADIFFGYDERNLFIGARVRDDVPCQRHTGWEIWNGDCLQVAFDPLSSRSRDGYGPNMHELGFTLVQDRPICLRWYGRRGQAREEVPSVRVAIRRDEDEGITTYEAAIPFAEVPPLCPEILPTTGFAIAVHDADGGDRESWAETAPGALTAGKHPDRFDTLRFDQAPAGAAPPGSWAALLWHDTVMPEGGTIEVSVLSVSREVEKGRVELEVAPAGPTRGAPGMSRMEFPVSDAASVRGMKVAPAVPAGEYRLRVTGTDPAGRTIVEETSPLYVFPR